jgi:TolB-like protein/DNA-binding winged helix-turn-helix (wHTH) protein/cytochrome c-type biogenesis protein CcmH/NrfG
MATSASSSPVQRFGVFEVDPRSRELRRKGHRVRMQDQPLEILLLLLERKGEVVTRDELKLRLWPADTFVESDDGINTAIRKLREVLGDSAEKPVYIETIPRRGYRFIGPVDVETAADSEAPAAPSIQTQTEMSSARRRWFKWIGAVALMSVLIAASAWMVLRERHREPGTKPALTSLAVLPFANLSGDPSQDYFADAMTEELTSDLGKISSLRVISRTSAMHYKNTQKTMPEIAQELNVDGVIESSVVRSGGRVRITSQLIDARADRHLWSESYEHDLKDVLALQSDIARTIAAQVRAVITPAEHERLQQPASINPEAYNAALLGTYFARKHSKPAIDKSIEHFQDAIRIDPNYARAYAGLANACFEREIWGGAGIGKSIGQIRAATAKALQLDNNLAEGHALLARIHFQFDWDWQGAELEYKRAIELNPNLADTYRLYAFYLQAMSRHNEALAAAHRAVELDPVYPAAYSDEGRIEYRARQFDNAVSSYQHALELEPDFVPALSRIVDAYEQAGKLDQALIAAKRFQETPNSPDAALFKLARIYARTGRRSDALELVRRAEDKNPENYLEAIGTYAVLGDSDRALTILQKAVNDRSVLPFVFVDPMLDPLRSDPRFQELLHRVGLR